MLKLIIVAVLLLISIVSAYTLLFWGGMDAYTLGFYGFS